MQSKTEILSAFLSKWSEIADLISKVDYAEFTHKPSPEVWSIAEEFDHVIKSASAVTSAMKVSPFILKWKFGKPNRTIRSYDEILAKYTNALASVKGNAVAPSPFQSEEGKTFDQVDMLNHWENTLKKFDQRVNKWSDKNIDNVLLPHPLLGKMMVRELLYFTHLHTEHHRKNLEKKITLQAL